MPRARFLSSVLAACVPVVLLVAPSPATADVATTTPDEAPMSRATLDKALDRALGRALGDTRDRDEDGRHGQRPRTKAPTVAEVYAQFQDVRANRLKSLGYFGDLEGLHHVLPVPAFSYHLTAGFGAFGPMWGSTHTGLDFAAPTGTPLVAVADGIITDVSLEPAYGLRTVLTLEDGTEVWYAHQDTSSVMPGQTVEIGHQVGTVGSSGNSTGPHVHLEVRPAGGAPVDPNLWLIEHQLTP